MTMTKLKSLGINLHTYPLVRETLRNSNKDVIGFVRINLSYKVTEQISVRLSHHIWHKLHEQK